MADRRHHGGNDRAKIERTDWPAVGIDDMRNILVGQRHHPGCAFKDGSNRDRHAFRVAG